MSSAPTPTDIEGRQVDPGPVCAMELEPKQTYMDWETGEVFTVSTIEPRGVAALITDTAGQKFRYGGLYRGLRLVLV